MGHILFHKNNHFAHNLGILVTFLLIQRDTTTKAHYKRKHLIEGSQWIRVHDPHVGYVATGSQAWLWSNSWELTSDPPTWGREKGRVGMVWAFKISKPPHPSGTPPLKMSPFLIFPKIILPARDHAFKHMSLWGHFHSNHHLESDDCLY